MEGFAGMVAIFVFMGIASFLGGAFLGFKPRASFMFFIGLCFSLKFKPFGFDPFDNWLTAIMLFGGLFDGFVVQKLHDKQEEKYEKMRAERENQEIEREEELKALSCKKCGDPYCQGVCDIVQDN